MREDAGKKEERVANVGERNRKRDRQRGKEEEGQIYKRKGWDRKREKTKRHGDFHKDETEKIQER